MSKAGSIWMPLHIRDYLADTRHLSTEAHGAYLLLLLDYWNRGGPLPDDDTYLRAVTGLTTRSWRALKPTICAFFLLKDGFLIQKRCEEELAKARQFIERQRNAGKKSAESRGYESKIIKFERQKDGY